MRSAGQHANDHKNDKDIDDDNESYFNNVGNNNKI